VRFRPGQRLSGQEITDRYFGGDSFAVRFLGTQRPAAVRGFRELRMAPYVFAGVVFVIALATMAHYLLTSAQRRRRDLAVLRALGMVPSRLRGVLGVQAVVVTVLALVVAIPVGLVGGRVLWQLTARWLYVADDVMLPALGVLGVAVVTVGAAAVLSLVAARRAAHQSPAAAFASE
jgi:putative ABC transport system permease protein